MKILADRRGSVALMTGIMAPVMVMVMALGIEVTSWSVEHLELQRIADISAWAGAKRYAAEKKPQNATAVAADMAEINGVSGALSRVWNASTLTISDNLITAQMVNGVRDAANSAIKVTVKRTRAKSFSSIFPNASAFVTLSAVAVAEIGSLGPQPCITALGNGVDGITTGVDVSVGGSASLVATGCSLRSNGGISQNGGGTINVSGVYAGGNISASGICCDLHANSGQIPDPYAANAPVQNALNALHPGSGTVINVKSNDTKVLSPGTYAGWDVKGTLNLNPGLYTVNGDISAGAQGIIAGTGVTIVLSGAINTVGGSTLALTAPDTHPTGSAIPGVLLAGRSTASMAFLGNSTAPVTGVIYLPYADLKFGGTSGSGSNGCTEVIASKVTLTGNSNLAANCAAYGALGFGSLPGGSSVAMVQ